MENNEKLTNFKKTILLDWFDKEAYMPSIKEHGILYISQKFKLAIHLCACGCGTETVMPFYQGELDDNNGWKMITKKIEGTIESDRPYDFTTTFTPSVGNQKLPCRSHYYITDSNIIWI